MRRCVLPAGLSALLFIASCGGSTPVTPSDAPARADVAGTVRDDAGQPIQGAVVTVLNGPSAGMSAVTDAGGRFVIRNLATGAAITLTVMRTGFIPATVPAAAGGGPLEIRLSGLPERLVTHTFTVTADAACDQLPLDARQRTYAAVVVPQAREGTLLIELVGADLYPGQATFSAHYDTDGTLQFSIWSWDAFLKWLDDLPIVEKVGETAYVEFSGTAVAERALLNGTVTASFGGVIAYCPRGDGNAIFFGCAVPSVQCTSARHQVTLTPR
jgi:hypothetical protein